MHISKCFASLAWLIASSCAPGPAPGDTGPPQDTGVATDVSADLGTAMNDASTRCGNGATDPGEACDGDSIACAMLGGSWSAGTAPCRAGCAGWDVSACTLRAPRSYEAVKPAVRDPARWEQARCNDGLPFGFLISLAPTPSHDWVIWLEGGGYCDDSTMSCTEREQRLTTTLGLMDRGAGPIDLRGIFSRNATSNPTFAGANLVKAHYCTSDFWSGATTERRPSSVSPGGWYYSGRANVRALFEVLTQRYGLDDRDPALRVLFGGDSAGSFGAHFNSAFAVQTLPGTHAGGRLKLFLDAPWFFDWDDPANRLMNATMPDREEWRRVKAFLGATHDPVCEATAADPNDCWFGATWYPIVSARLPTFVQQCRLDEVFGLTIHPHLGMDPAAKDAWRAQLIASTGGVSRFFSGPGPYHVLAGSDQGWALGPAGSTLQEMVSRFFNDGPPERVTF